jgi:Xaa-Pro dipeptidase
MLSYHYEAASPAQQRELAGKRVRLTQLLNANGLDGLIINTQKNFAWATAGANNWVNTSEERGVAALVFRADGTSYLVANNLEFPRLKDEEKLADLDFELISAPWWEANQRDSLLLDIAGGQSKKIGCDVALPGTQEIDQLITQARWSLLPDERDRYRQVCQAAGEALESTCTELVPGLGEWEVAGYLAEACYQRGLVPFVTLVAADERVYNYRHPIPTEKQIERYVMVVLCAKAGGLIANCTRLVHFGPVTPDLLQKQRELLTVDATFNLLTRPGVAISEIFAKAQQAYAYAGYPDEWQLHHQGGATGYTARDYLGGPNSIETVQEWQAFAWNPSITGTKSEDTVLVASEPGHELEILTRPAGSNWPTSRVTIEGLGSLERPDILEK